MRHSGFLGVPVAGIERILLNEVLLCQVIPQTNVPSKQGRETPDANLGRVSAYTGTLSISRVRPILAATRSRKGPSAALSTLARVVAWRASR